MIPFCGGGEDAPTTGFLLLFPLPEILAPGSHMAGFPHHLYSEVTFSVRPSLITFLKFRSLSQHSLAFFPIYFPTWHLLAFSPSIFCLLSLPPSQIEGKFLEGRTFPLPHSRDSSQPAFYPAYYFIQHHRTLRQLWKYWDSLITLPSLSLQDTVLFPAWLATLQISVLDSSHICAFKRGEAEGSVLRFHLCSSFTHKARGCEHHLQAGNSQVISAAQMSRPVVVVAELIRAG